MTTFVALLRGINVSGQRRIPMAELRRSCEALGLEDVQTYLQSGNLVFGAREKDPNRIAALLRARIDKDFGHDVEALVISAEQYGDHVRANPLSPTRGAKANLYHGTFLSRPIPDARLRALELPAKSSERIALAGQVVYLYCPDGYGKTKLTNAFFEKVLQTPATTRNWRTILALQDMCNGRQRDPGH